MGIFKSRDDKNRDAFVADYFEHFDAMAKGWKKSKYTPDRGDLSLTHMAATDHALRQAKRRGDYGLERQATADNLWEIARRRYPDYPFGNPPTLV